MLEWYTRRNDTKEAEPKAFPWGAVIGGCCLYLFSVLISANIIGEWLRIGDTTTGITLGYMLFVYPVGLIGLSICFILAMVLGSRGVLLSPVLAVLTVLLDNTHSFRCLKVSFYLGYVYNGDTRFLTVNKKLGYLRIE